MEQMASNCGPVLSFSSQKSRCCWKQLCREAFSFVRRFWYVYMHVCVWGGGGGIPLPSDPTCLPLAFWLFLQLWTPGNTLPRPYLVSFLLRFSMYSPHSATSQCEASWKQWELLSVWLSQLTTPLGGWSNHSFVERSQSQTGFIFSVQGWESWTVLVEVSVSFTVHIKPVFQNVFCF